MAQDAISEHVFLDTQVFVQFGFKYASTPFKSLAGLVTRGRLKLLVTDIVVREVEAQIVKAVGEAAASHRRFSKEAAVLGGSTLDAIRSKVDKLDEGAAVANIKENFHNFLAGLKAVTLATSDAPLQGIVDDYFAGNAPFGTGDKKAEFPDAINVKVLADWGDSEGAHVLVVSGDNGVREACGQMEFLIAKATIQEMLNYVADDDKKLAAFVRAEVNERESEITTQVIDDFPDRFFFLIDEDGDAQVTVEKALLVDVEILEMGDREGIVEASYHVDYEASVSYADPDLTSYDSETGESFSWGTRRATVHRATFARVEIGVLFDGLDPDSFELNYVSMTVPGDSFGIPVYDPRDDK